MDMIISLMASSIILIIILFILMIFIKPKHRHNKSNVTDDLEKIKAQVNGKE